jgi:hypothetical protein
VCVQRFIRRHVPIRRYVRTRSLAPVFVIESVADTSKSFRDLIQNNALNVAYKT